MAIAGLKGGLRMISQEAVRFYGGIGYHPYEGITEDFGERERLIKNLGDNRAMILHNHGVLTVGKSARDAFVLMRHLIEAAEIQLKMMATGAELIEIPDEVCRKTVNAIRQTHDSRPRLGRLAGLSAHARPASIRATRRKHCGRRVGKIAL